MVVFGSIRSIEYAHCMLSSVQPDSLMLFSIFLLVYFSLLLELHVFSFQNSHFSCCLTLFISSVETCPVQFQFNFKCIYHSTESWLGESYFGLTKVLIVRFDFFFDFLNNGEIVESIWKLLTIGNFEFESESFKTVDDCSSASKKEKYSKKYPTLAKISKNAIIGSS